MACRRLEWSVLLLAALALLILPLKWLFAVILAMAVHELGHYLALGLCGVKVSGFHIGPAGIRMNVRQMGRFQELFCALAGPLAGLCLLLLSKWIPRTAVCACVHSLYNLLPVYPLDGGRVLRCIAGSRVSYWIELVCIVCIACAGLYGSMGLKLGWMPLAIAGLTIHRALAGKGLAKRGLFRYNRERIYE